MPYTDGMSTYVRRALAAAISISIITPLITSALTPPVPNPIVSVAGAAVSNCPVLTRSLLTSATGADVKGLQQFLIQQGYLANDLATSYFGVLTTRAVQAFQSAKGIVSSGTPETTGFGLVGVRTRAAIAAACSNTSSLPPALQKLSEHLSPKLTNAACPVVQAPIGKACAGKWKEVRDAANKCTAAWQCVTR
jgi:peptidoglycan hydrolase-like protein with peptidoglycan-binding domain